MDPVLFLLVPFGWFLIFGLLARSFWDLEAHPWLLLVIIPFSLLASIWSFDLWENRFYVFAGVKGFIAKFIHRWKKRSMTSNLTPKEKRGRYLDFWYEERRE
ncbi:hypothetical protein [Moorella sp. Hama-1]|uniref:hypothetical protein n=1 Tax=Moorella sp. Hama-1 TaxID=2138101 RepID=UPI000D649920|nr:hypothetical protein [Moorella sp. Hama-1]BCV20384.1 hypothetical protein hamaS1_04530 [Moorella sp. Hama-1]